MRSSALASLLGIVVIAGISVVGLPAHAEGKVLPRLLVLPLPPSDAIDANAARAFDARLLVALDDSKRVVTLTHDEEPECTTPKCLATLGSETGAAYVLSLSVVREDGGLTLFGTVIDAKTGTAWRRVELPRITTATLGKAPAELVPQIVGPPPGGIVLGFSRPSSVAGQTAALAVTDQLAALKAFKVQPLEGSDRSALTHRAELVITQLTIEEPRRHLCKFLDGTLVGTFSVIDLSNGHVIFTKTVTITESKRARFTTRGEVTDDLVAGAVTDWMTAFRASGTLKPRR